jgi:hypothetical protein
MITKLSLAACLAWAACAISYATPADALAFTMQTGPYATCSASYDTQYNNFCYTPDIGGYLFYTSYRQQIRFVGSGCNTGGVCAQGGDVWTDMLYTTGRKPATLYYYCEMTGYGLDTCAC